MLTAEMLADAQHVYAAEIKAGEHPERAVRLALSAALEHFQNENLKLALDNERQHRKDEALCIRHAIFSVRPGGEEIQRLISYLVRWNTAFNTGRIARATGVTSAIILQEVERWIEANPGKLIFDGTASLYRTPRAARQAARQQNILLQEGISHDQR